MTTDELHTQLDGIETELLTLADKTTGKPRAMALTAIMDIQATRLSLLANALRSLGLTTEANQADMTARITHAQAQKGLPHD